MTPVTRLTDRLNTLARKFGVPIHEKAMSVILHPEHYDRWLDGEADDACSLASPFPPQLTAVE